MADKEPHNDITIIKRRMHEDDGHHGGAWKIAFADFMTAMMALFLVLWLISSASDKTKHAVAQYFNPVKLVDVTTLKKGFRDPKKTELGAGPKMTETKVDADTNQDLVETREVVAQPGAKVRTLSDTMLFRDPYAALAEIAGDETQPAAQERADQSGEGGEDSAETFADPFMTVPRVRRPSPAPTETASSSPDAAAAAPERAAAAPAPAPRAQAIATVSRQAKAEAAAGAHGDAAAKLAAEIAAPGGAAARAATDGPRVEVESTSEGLLISLTDDRDFEMFAIGSAVPQPQTVEVMAKIGALLKSRPGAVVVRGHTDARPFRSAAYDNWRLSGARAHMAQYMLTRGGLEEKRIERIEAYADRHPRLPAEPLAAVNRRIEILLRKDKP